MIAHRRRLAGAVGTEETENLAGLDAEPHVVDGRDRPVAFREVLNLNHGVTPANGLGVRITCCKLYRPVRHVELTPAPHPSRTAHGRQARLASCHVRKTDSLECDPVALRRPAASPPSGGRLVVGAPVPPSFGRRTGGCLVCRARSRCCSTATACRTSTRAVRRTRGSRPGVLHARDRLWQMELYRRVDRRPAVRDSRRRDAAHRQAVPDARTCAPRPRPSGRAPAPEVRAALKRYADGVNASIGAAQPAASGRSSSSSWASRRRRGRRSIRWRSGGCWRGGWPRTTRPSWSGTRCRREARRRRRAAARGTLSRRTRPTVLGIALRRRARPLAGADARGRRAASAAAAAMRRGWRAPAGQRADAATPTGRRARMAAPDARSAATRTTGCSRARARRAAGRCWPTIRTCRSSSRRSGTRCTWSPPGSTSSASRFPGTPFVIIGHNAPHRLGHDQHRRRRPGPVRRADRPRAAALPVRRRMAAGQGRRRVDIPVRGGRARGRSRSGGRARASIFADVGLDWEAPPAWLSPGRRRAGGRAARASRCAGQASTATSAGAFEALESRRRLDRRSSPPSSASPRRRRTSSTPTSTATSATRMSGRLPVRVERRRHHAADGRARVGEWSGGCARAALPRVLNPRAGYITSSNNEIDRRASAADHARLGGAVPRDAAARGAGRGAEASGSTRWPRLCRTTSRAWRPTRVLAGVDAALDDGDDAGGADAAAVRRARPSSRRGTRWSTDARS